MRHRKKGKTLSRKTGPRKALMRTLATSFALHEKIETTETKAKALKPIIEKYITVAGKGDLAARRQLLRFFYTENTVNKMMDVIGPRYKERAGGYTRIIKKGQRQGDGAPIVILEMV